MEKPVKVAIEYKYKGLSYRIAYYEGYGPHFWKWDVEKSSRIQLHQGRECWRKVDIEELPQEIIDVIPCYWLQGGKGKWKHPKK